MSIFDVRAFRDHEDVHYFTDPTGKSNFRTIIAIHNTTLGPALGGWRMHPYAAIEDAEKDVLRLSRAMTYKNALAGVPLGGGKAVTIADPHTDKSPELMHAFARAVFSLGGRYLPGEDVGIEVADIESVAMELERISHGTPLEKVPMLTGRNQAHGGPGDPAWYTSRGVLIGIKAALKERLGEDTLSHITVAVQGFAGHVGKQLTHLLLSEGATVYGVDVDKENIKHALCFFSSVGKGKFHILDNMDAIYDTPHVDVFSPCAMGAILNKETIPRLTCKIVAGSANNQLEYSYDARILKSFGILYIPDYVINAGGLISVAEEYSARLEHRPFNINGALRRVKKIGDTIATILQKSRNDGVLPSKAADDMAERIIANAKKNKTSV